MIPGQNFLTDRFIRTGQGAYYVDSYEVL